jgi:acyl-CoA thioesterase-2
MQEDVDKLVALFELEELEVNLFRGRNPKDERKAVFGGQVAGQALRAAGRTVEGRAVHSLHAYFLRPGDPKTPILYQVERLRDGRSFTTRRVTAIQHGEAIFALSSSFQVAEQGVEHQADMPDAPEPENLPTEAERLETIRAEGIAVEEWMLWDLGLDTRYADPKDETGKEEQAPLWRTWFKADGQLPDDPLLHRCVIAYGSDMTLIDTALRPHPEMLTGNTQVASLDHAMWFHRPVRADEWLLYVQESPSMAGSRGFSTGQLFTREGKLAVSVAQEGLVRARP